MHYDKLSKYDKIIIEARQDIERIMEWSHNNWESIDKSDFGLPMLEGVVDFPPLGFGDIKKDSDLYFKVDNDKLSFKLFIDRELFSEFDMNVFSSEIDFDNVNVNLSRVKMSNDEIKHMCQVTALNFAYIMQYFVYFSKNENIVKESTVKNVSTKKANKNKKGKNNKGRIVIGSKRMCRIYAPTDLNTSGRKYERHTEGWTVRGYWRYYKKSKKWGWVNGHPKGNKRNITPKEYQLK